MLTDKQLEQRKSTIGASEIAAVCGISPWSTPFDVYNRKLGISTFQGNDATKAGHYLEEAVAKWFSDEKKIKVRRNGKTLLHKKHRWMSATPDYYVVNDSQCRQELVECKTAGGKTGVDREGNKLTYWGDENTEVIPEYYRTQCQWQMSVTGLRVCYVPVLFMLSRKFEVFKVEHSDDLEKILIDRGNEFWHKHVLEQNPPEIDASKACADYLSARNKQTSELIVEAPIEAEKWAERLMNANAIIEEQEKIKEEAQNYLKSMVGEYKGIESHWGRFLWYTTQSSGLDWKGVASSLFDKLCFNDAARAEFTQEFKRPGSRRVRFTPSKTE